MHVDVEELRPKLKEVLYDCAVDIKATKAALFLLDPGIRKFELVADYGFKTGIRAVATYNDPLIDRCQRGRVPFYVNTVAADPKLSDLMFDGASERLMAVPLYSRGQLIGFIDIRDKAAKQPFDQSDVSKAQAIGDKILGLFATKNVWNQRFITLAEADSLPMQAAPVNGAAIVAAPEPLAAMPQLQVRPATAPAPTPPPVAKRPEEAVARPSVRVSEIVTAARSAAGRLAVPPSPEPIGEAALAGARDVLRAILNLPHAVLAAVSATANNAQEVAGRSTVTDDALATLRSKLNSWLTKRGEGVGVLKTNVQTPFGTNAPPVTGQHMQKVFTAPVVSASFRSVYLTVGFSDNPDRATHEMLAALLNQLQLSIDEATSREHLQSYRARVAAKIVEPDFMAYPDLRRHSEAVAARTAAFAQFLGLTAAEVETVTLTALVHDAGMRLLDYDRLYKKRDLTGDELGLLREHVFVGAAMAQPLLGNEIARAVLCHHERVDGRGYPNELHGDEIPLAARILQICDTYVAITDPSTYQPVESAADALASIARGAGSQFDAELAGRFSEMMNVS